MSESLESRLARIRFIVAPPGGDRIHHVSEADVRIVLSRLPYELWQTLRAVHFNDCSRGRQRAGYVTQGHREIALCSLPPRISLNPAFYGGQRPESYGANRGYKWPALAVRRFMLYDVFLHELGHLQLVDEQTRSQRLKFAHERLAHMFSRHWRKQLWSVPFEHIDPVHNPPRPEELELCTVAV